MPRKPSVGPKSKKQRVPNRISEQIVREIRARAGRAATFDQRRDAMAQVMAEVLAELSNDLA
jgi:hypothetical protein